MSHVLHLGDCLEGMAAMPDRSVDHVITDPPYSERVHRGHGAERRNDGADARGDLSFLHVTQRDRLRVAAECARVARRWIVVFSDDESVLLWKLALERAGADWCVSGHWIKEQPMPRMAGDRPAYGAEAISVAHGPRLVGRTRWNGGGRPALWLANPQEQERIHPNQKPLSLIEALVRDFTDPGELICDPFAGSGTTGVACKRLGRRFVGWEKDPKFHAAAVKLIDAAREQFQLPRLPKAKQTGMVLHAPGAEAGDAIPAAQGGQD